MYSIYSQALKAYFFHVSEMGSRNQSLGSLIRSKYWFCSEYQLASSYSLWNQVKLSFHLLIKAGTEFLQVFCWILRWLHVCNLQTQSREHGATHGRSSIGEHVLTHHSNCWLYLPSPVADLFLNTMVIVLNPLAINYNHLGVATKLNPCQTGPRFQSKCFRKTWFRVAFIYIQAFAIQRFGRFDGVQGVGMEALITQWFSVILATEIL